eukprot:TRINITY_DN6877_c0_g1_i4.p1 TRINITY_DN6877_c0_g1~~TRINITY_DN6877_c0_g1_i4.p1  ORF type:complete len:294 (-),score=94.24 TRINITY_DN6877_c0_g1_i4:113-994(-)
MFDLCCLFFFFLMIRRPPRSTQGVSSAASDVYKRQVSTQSTWGVTPMDKSTKKSLQKTTTQAIEITSKVQEQEARRQAEKIEQEEKAKLERQILESKTIVEEARKKLLELKADSDSVKSKGQAIAEARAKAEAAEIASKADVTFAELKAMANTIHKKEEIAHLILKNEIALNHKKAMNALKVAKSRELAVVESNKFDKIMKSLGPETLVEIANAGPESQSKMLSSLGLQGYMLMDSKNPINLFTSAAGMIEPPNKPQLLSLIHISEPTRPLYISYAVFCLKKKKKSTLTLKKL